MISMTITQVNAKVFAPLLICSVLAGCTGGVTVSINDQAVYDPNNRLGGAGVASANLQGCINFTMDQQQLESLSDVTVLACPDSNIVDLGSINLLSRLRFLDLANNAIQNATPLELLTNLSGVNLDNNVIRDVAVFINMTTLTSLSIKGNDNIPCAQLAVLQERLGDNFIGPESCRS